VLTGDGGDEALAGYERFPATLLADHMRLPAQRGTGAMARQLPRSASYHRLRRCLARFVGELSLRSLIGTSRGSSPSAEDRGRACSRRS